LDDYRKSVQIAEPLGASPRFERVLEGGYRGISRVQARAGNPRAALATMEEFQRRFHSKDPLMHSFRAAYLAATGNLPAARDLYETIIGGYSTREGRPGQLRFAGLLHNDLAGVLGDPRRMNLGDPTGARKHYEIAVQLARAYEKSVPKDSENPQL